MGSIKVFSLYAGEVSDLSHLTGPYRVWCYLKRELAQNTLLAKTTVTNIQNWDLAQNTLLAKTTVTNIHNWDLSNVLETLNRN